MKNMIQSGLNRRQFLTGAIPVCAAGCLMPKSLVAMIQSDLQQAKHKFDLPIDRPLTNRQYARASNRGKISLIKTLIKELGEEKAIEIIKTDTRENALAMGKRQAQAAEKNDLNTYVDMFRDTEGFKNTLSMEIIEDTEKAFELKITECLFAQPYLEAGLGGKVGHAALCYMDYFWPQGFNENIKMIRDKTLMQGHAYCNHRYVWTG